MPKLLDFETGHEAGFDARARRQTEALDFEGRFAAEGLECLIEYRAEDETTGIQYRDCLIDHTTCPNQRCVKKLM